MSFPATASRSYSVLRTVSNVASRGISISMTPRGPVLSMVSLNETSHRTKKMWYCCHSLFPLCTKGFTNSWYFINFFHLQEPILELSLTDQNEPFWIRNFQIQETHIDGCFETILHINLRQLTLFASSRDLMPKPPSAFRLQTTFHAILDLLGLSSGPGDIFSISLVHPFGSRYKEIQNFDKLAMNDFISSKLDKVLISPYWF